jgi:hypothetical protein
VRAKRTQRWFRERFAKDNKDHTDRECHPEGLRGEPRGPFRLPGAGGSGDDGSRPVREEVEDRERTGQHRSRETEPRELRPAKVPDDRRIDEDVERLGRKRAERRQSEPDDFAVVWRAQAPHGARR